MEFAILGPLVVTRGGEAVDVGGPKPRALLALLTIHRGQTVSSDRIVDVLWGDRAPAQALATLQAYVSTLRRLLEPDRRPREPARVLVTRGDGYMLDVAGDQVDAVRFERHARAARESVRAGRCSDAANEAAAGLALWRGEPVPELDDHPLGTAERVRLEELRRGLREDQTEAAIVLGHPAVGECEALISEDPLRERPWRLLLHALARDGRIAEALERYRDHRRLLADELGLEPSDEMEQLQLRLLAGEPLAATPASPATVERTTPTTSLVGREAELAELTAVLRAAVDADRPSWVLVTGEAGVGKTALVGELSRSAEAAGVRVAWTRCVEDGDTPPYWPVRELLVGLGVPGIPDLSAEIGLDERARTYDLFDRIATALADEGRAAPLLLVVDDLQWADAATVRLLTFLASRPAAVPITVVATVRAGEDHQPIEGLLSALVRYASVHRLEVGPLPHAAVAELVRRRAGRDLDPAIVDQLWERTSGNPFYVTELLRLPVDEWRQQDTAVPPGVREVVRRRVRRLGENVADVLNVAAAIGVDFDLPLVIAAAEGHPDEVVAALDRALAAGLVAGEGTELRFTHALVRDTLSGDLTVLAHQALHARIADALEALPDEARRRRLGQLARHHLAAIGLRGAGSAVAALREAAFQAEAELGHEQAAAWLATALDLIDHDAELSQDHGLRHRVLLDRGRALLIAGDFREGWQSLIAAFDVAAENDDVDGMAAAMIAVPTGSASWFWVPFRMEPLELLSRIARALDALPPDDVQRRIALMLILAEGGYYLDRQRAAALAEDAVALAREQGGPDVLAGALLTYVECTWLLVPPAEHLGLLDEYDAIPGPRPATLDARAVLLRWRACVELDRREDAVVVLARAQRMAAELPLPSFAAEVAWATITQRVLEGDIDDLAAAIDRAADLHERSGLYAARAMRALHRGLLCWWEGRASDAEVDFRRDALHFGAGVAEFGALFLLDRGRVDEARQLLEAEVEPLPDDWSRRTIACIRAWVAAKAGALALLEDVLPVLERHRDEIDVYGTGASLGPVGLFLGVAHRALGHEEAAERALRSAVETADRGLAGPWGTLARNELAGLMAAAGRGGGETAP